MISVEKINILQAMYTGIFLTLPATSQAKSYGDLFIGPEVMVTLTLTCETCLLTYIDFARNLVCIFSGSSFSLLKTRTCHCNKNWLVRAL